jgi:hypothetical protein
MKDVGNISHSLTRQSGRVQIRIFGFETYIPGEDY